MSFRRSVSMVVGAVATLSLLAMPATALPVLTDDFAGPLFGVSTIRDAPGLVVADAGAGIVRVRNKQATLLAELPGVVDVAPVRNGGIHALTGETDSTLYWYKHGRLRERADIGAFEAAVNPDGGEIHSNPFDVDARNRSFAVVADAGGNALLSVDAHGNVDWIASFPSELVSTENAKRLAGCPEGPEDICGLPAMIPAEPVTTSVEIGRDGAYYVGELKGFPAPRRESRIWRVEPDAHHAVCGESSKCEVVGDGFTSIIDLSSGPGGTLYVTELDEASWFAAESGAGVGGSVNACRVRGSEIDCERIARGLTMPTATAASERRVVATVEALIPGGAKIVRIAP
ncbi:MAG TPA: ScyD/ScyE family protein [Actinomycetota bacterium]|nr:ScyD/ScyE family protein [Actinomycetota bacterium]